MGGFGSGQRWSKKDTVEDCYSIDTATLKRWNMHVPGTTNRAGSFKWRRGREEKPSSSVGYRLTVGADSGTLRFLYSIKSLNAELDYAVKLVTTPCHLGGVRWWFICPLVNRGVTCERRVRKLYLDGKYFGCRHCHDLTYTSSQQSDSRVYKALRNGLDFDALGDPRRLSIAQLGFALKVLTFEKRCLDKFAKRMDGKRRGNGSEAKDRNNS